MLLVWLPQSVSAVTPRAVVSVLRLPFVKMICLGKSVSSFERIVKNRAERVTQVMLLVNPSTTVRRSFICVPSHVSLTGPYLCVCLLLHW